MAAGIAAMALKRTGSASATGLRASTDITAFGLDGAGASVFHMSPATFKRTHERTGNR